MAFYALDEEGRLISSTNACPNKTYLCIECQARTRMRLAGKRRSHFCHVRSAPACRLHSKKNGHLPYQNHLSKQNPQLELERPFVSILRIADLCWEEKKIVFEIQCSPISVYEVNRRKEDYERLGYRLIWLLDDRLYGKKNLKKAEDAMLRQGAYFFSCSTYQAYDRFEVIERERRILRGFPLSIDLARPLIKEQSPFELSRLGLRGSPLYFSGDLYERLLKNPKKYRELLYLEKRAKASLKSSLWSGLKSLLLQGFEYLLRKSL